MSEHEFTRLVARSLTPSFLPSLGRKRLFVFPLTNVHLHLTKRKMLSIGLADVKHSEAMSAEVITALSIVCGVSIFLFELESICSPSYETNVGSWQAWFLIT